MVNLNYWSSFILPVGILYFMLWWRSKSRKCDVKGKVVLITGASSGLGEACAHIFYQAGAKVIICARRMAELQRVKEDLLKKNLPCQTFTPEILQFDLSQLDDVSKKAEIAIGIHGNIDILINNGGISNRGNVMETSLDTVQKLMTVNYFGHVALTKGILPGMLSRKHGTIVAVSSLQGRFAIPFRSSYAASKHALQAFFDSLRAEVSHHNVHVCVVSPGYINTQLSLNALNPDGTKYGVIDENTASGMSADYVAKQILYAVEYRKEEVILAKFIHRFAIYLRVLSPWTYMRIMKQRAKNK